MQRNRSAIYQALCTVLPEEDAETAVDIWEQNFSVSGSPFNGLNLFVRNICQTYDKPDQRKELLQAISRALLDREQVSTQSKAQVPAKSSDQPSVVPKLVIMEASPEPIAEPEMNTVEFASFQSLLSAWLIEINQHDEKMGLASREFLQKVVEDLPWSLAQQEQIIKFIHTGNTVQTRPYRNGQLKTLTKHFNAWVQETLGDQVAARITEQALNKVAQSSATMSYSPHDFFET